jgi:Mg2+ and Co2+ transporter CorA
MKKYQEIPEIEEYIQAQELMMLADLARFGISEGNFQIELCKDELKEITNMDEREEILLQVKDIQQHIDTCQNSLKFFKTELKSLVYIFN